MEGILAIVFAQAVVFCYCLCILVAFWRRRHLTKVLRIFCLHIALTVIIACIVFGFIWVLQIYDVYMFVMPFLTRIGIEDNAFLFVLYYLNNTLILGWFYKILLANKHSTQKLNGVIVAVLLLEFLIYFFVDGYNKPGQINPVVDAVFCFSLPGYYLWVWYHNEKSVNLPLIKNAYFLISIGLIFQNLIAFLYFCVLQTLYLTDPNLYDIATSIKSCIQILAIFLFGLAIFQAKYTRFLPAIK